MQTVIGVFDDKAAASKALETLKSSGFSDSSIQLTGSSAASAGTTTPAADEGLVAEIGSFLSRLFGDDNKSQTSAYSEAVRRGGYVVTVDVDNEVEAEAVAGALEHAGAYDIDERATQWKAEGWQSTATTAYSTAPTAVSPTMSASSSSVEGKTVLPVVEEELKVGKRTVQRGGIRVVRRVTETPVSESVSLTEEHATIERRPVDRVATAADLSGLRDVSIEVRETAEEAVVSKEARVVEEVVVGKAATERTENVSDTVRRTDVEVEHFDSGGSPAVTTVKDSTALGSADDQTSDWKGARGPQGGL